MQIFNLMQNLNAFARPRFFRLKVAACSLLLLIAVGVATAAAWFFQAAHSALPQVDGWIPVSGLSRPVRVVRDREGVPHITAETLDDLFFAQGYITAQDRLWQMDMLRRFGAGELAENLGPGPQSAILEHDRQQRILGMRIVAENAAARLPTRDRKFLDDYARGVNAFITGAKSLPLEFQMLRYRPKPWTIVDSFLAAGNMVQTLNLAKLPHQLSREAIIGHLTPELAADLYPNSSWRDHPPGELPGIELEPGATPAEEKELSRLGRMGSSDRVDSVDHYMGQQENSSREERHSFLLSASFIKSSLLSSLSTSSSSSTWSIGELLPGSNDWVISGAHTASGKPLLANDMHLAHSIPNVWYEAHLTSGAFDVAGVSLPGIPYIIVGHNRRIGWGFTSVEPTVADLFIEHFNESGEYETPDGWRQPRQRREVIHVRRRGDEIVDVRITRHGPVISELVRRYAKVRPANGVQLQGPADIMGSGSHASEEFMQLENSRELALEWTAYQPDAIQVPFFDMALAENWEQFRAALRRFPSPATNVVYADVDGHIGYQATGMIPIRAAGDGALPVSGADNAHEWTGYIPFEQLPSVYDPSSGVIATANGRITPQGSPLMISNEWGPPYRTQRIYRVLTADRKFSPPDMLALQNDIYSDFDRFCAQRFVYALDHAAAPGLRLQQAAELMRSWDGHLTVNSAAANVAVHSRLQLVRLLLEPRLGGLWQEYAWYMSSVWIENMLMRQPPRWLPSGYADWNELLLQAVQAAISEPGVPADLGNWNWGTEHRIQIEHPLFGRVPILRRWAGTGSQPQSGDGFTVKQVGSRFGPSERLTIDFSNLDETTLNIVNGESGNLFSPYFLDQWAAWYGGTTFSFPFSEAAVKKAKAHELTLQPK